MFGLKLAIQQASKSEMHQRHGAVIYKRGEILGAGFNINCCPIHTRSDTPFPERVSRHAEDRALAGLRHDQIRGSTMLVIRINNDNSLMMSKPCKRCVSVLKRKGIRKVIYSVSNNTFDKIFL